MRVLFFLVLALANALKTPLCRDCRHMIGKEPGRCALYPNIVDDLLEFGIKIPIRVNFTPCPVARRYATLCGRKGKRFKKIEPSLDFQEN